MKNCLNEEGNKNGEHTTAQKFHMHIHSRLASLIVMLRVLPLGAKTTACCWKFSLALFIAADEPVPFLHIVTPNLLLPAGHVDLRAKGGSPNEHRCAAPQICPQLPRLTRHWPGQLPDHPPQPVHGFDPDQWRPHERRGPLHLRVRHLPAWQRARHRVPGHARYVPDTSLGVLRLGWEGPGKNISVKHCSHLVMCKKVGCQKMFKSCYWKR